MRILLDTCAFLRIVSGERLPQKVRRILDQQGTELVISIVSCWEIAMKPALNLTSPEVEANIHLLGASILPIQLGHIQEYSRVPQRADHRDPFDRMLIAQATSERLAIMTADVRFENYEPLRVIWD